MNRRQKPLSVLTACIVLATMAAVGIATVMFAPAPEDAPSAPSYLPGAGPGGQR